MFLTLKQEAANEQTSPKRLEFLASTNEELARLVARNPNANSELLTALASSKDFTTRAGVAGNPNTPPEVLWKLAEVFPQEFLNNPVLPFLSLENPNYVLEQFLSLLALLKQHTVPKWILLEATKHKDDRVLMAVAKNSQIDDEVIEKLIATQSYKVQLHLIQHCNILGKLLKELSENKISNYRYRTTIRQAVAKHSDTPSEVLGKLAFDSESKVKKAVASRCDLSVDLIAKIAADRQIIAKKFLLRNKSFSAEMLSTLARYKEPKVLQMVALHPQTPLEVLKELATVKEASYFVAQNSRINREIIESLIKTNQTKVYFSLAKNHQTPPDILSNLALKLSDIDTLIAIAENKNSSEDTKRKIIEKLLSCSRYSVLKYIARSPYTSDNILISWSSLKYYREIYPDLAQNPKTPPIVLDKLARKNLNYKIAMGLVKNPKTSREIIEYLYKKRHQYSYDYSYLHKLDIAIARNHNTPGNILEKISYGKCNFYLAQNPNTSEKTLIDISKYYSQYDYILLERPNISLIALENILNRRSKSFYASDRKFVARHSQTSISILKTLTQDKDYKVRNIAEYRLKQYNCNYNG